MICIIYGEVHKLPVFANRMLTEISGPRGEEIGQKFWVSRNEELHLLNIVRTVKFKKLRQTGFEAKAGSTQTFDVTVF
jgi:hypothetical protein